MPGQSIERRKNRNYMEDVFTLKAEQFHDDILKLKADVAWLKWGIGLLYPGLAGLFLEIFLRLK